MYFLDEQHELNFNHLTRMVFPYAKNDPEYKVAAYVLSHSRIYKECVQDPLFNQYPFLWMYQYEDRSYTETDSTGEEYIVEDFYHPFDEDNNPIKSESFTALSSGEKQLVYLAQNLFNSSNNTFNLMDALGTWDEFNILVFKEALKIRMNREL